MPLHEYSPRGSPDWENRAEPLSRQELARVDRLARKLDNVSAVGMEVHVTDAGLHFGPAEPQSFDARITGQVTSSIPFYDFAELVYNPAVDDWVAREGGVAGTPTNGVQAVESTGNAAVPADPTTGARVRLHRLAPGRYGFTYPAAGLTVEELDGSPSVSPVTTLQFDQSSGLAVTNPSAGVALVTFAGDDVPRDEGRATTVDIRRPFGAASPTTSNVACTIYEDLYRGRGSATGTNYLTWSHFFDFASTVDVRDATSRGAGNTLFSYADGDQLNEPTGAGHTSYVVVWVTKLAQGGTTIKRAYCMRDTPVWPGP